jgi:hypothetical protein
MSTDAKHTPLSQADRLRQVAETAAAVRKLSNHPDVIALRTDKVRGQVDAGIWVGILLGLAFTMVNVQSFAAAGAALFSLPWIAAWLLDPMVSLVLVAVLRAEQVTARYQVETGEWVHRTKWFAFLATYVMNTWQSWTAGHPSGIVLHSVPPVLAFLAAETAPVLRDRLTEAVNRAAMPAFTGQPTEADTAGTEVAAAAVSEPVADTPAVSAPRTAPARRRKAAPARKTGRKLLADYLTEARAAWAPGIEITPAWVRSVCPDASRGTSKNVADALAAETATAPTALPIPTTTTAARDEEAA